MSSRSSVVQLPVSLPTKDYDVFVAAIGILQRLMGRNAPTLVVLVQHTLRGRDAKGMADDYLDFIGWPVTAGRSVALRRQNLSPLRPRFRRLKSTSASTDPSRN